MFEESLTQQSGIVKEVFRKLVTHYTLPSESD
jgi:hypothetical protein